MINITQTKTSLSIENFIIQLAKLENVSIDKNKLCYEYSLDGTRHSLIITYNSPNVEKLFSNSKFKQDAYAFAVVLGVINLTRFGSVLPRKLDISRFSQWINADLLNFLSQTIPHVWSEHRYQLHQTDFVRPEFIFNSSELDSATNFPLWNFQQIINNQTKLLVASGAGKDSLLCERLLEKAAVDYDIVTMNFDICGDFDKQDSLFVSAFKKELSKIHKVYIKDEYYPWLEERINNFEIRTKLTNKPFRVDAGGNLQLMFICVPIQVSYGYEIQAWGNEKSADLPNLTTDNGEEIAHQWLKSFAAEQQINQCFNKLFNNVKQASLLKPIEDVKIFKTLFSLDKKLVYKTHSCNFGKPWCCKCEKCAYVFAGFAAYGDFDKTVTAFGQNLFEKTDLLPIWSELMGLKNYIPWECIGSGTQVQIYFYRCFKKGITGAAVDFFIESILQDLHNQGMSEADIDRHFQMLEDKYSVVHENHHTMPDWLWTQIKPLLADVSG